MASKQSDLEDEIFRACRRGPEKIFVTPNSGDETDFPNLARISRNVERVEWEKPNRPNAFCVTLERAIKLMPEGKHPNSTISWQEVARTLCGFRLRNERKVDGRRLNYSERLSVLEEEINIPSGIDKREWLKDHITSTCRELLEEALLELEGNVQGEGHSSSSGEDSEPHREDVKSSSAEDDGGNTNSTILGIVNIFPRGGISIKGNRIKLFNKKTGISLSLFSAAALALILAYNLTPATPAEDETGENVNSSPSVAPVIRGQKVDWSGDCYGGEFIPDKTLEEVEALVQEAEDRGVSRDGTMQSVDEFTRIRGVEESVLAVGFTVHASNDATITIDNLVVNANPRPAPEGVILRDSCGDATPNQYTRLDLDNETFDTRIPTPDEHVFGLQEDLHEFVEERYAIEVVDLRLPFSISGDEPAAFLLVPTTKDCWCEWTLTLKWSSHSEEGEITIDNAGEPFVTISPSKMDRYQYQYTSSFPDGTWVLEG